MNLIIIVFLFFFSIYLRIKGLLKTFSSCRNSQLASTSLCQDYSPAFSHQSCCVIKLTSSDSLEEAFHGNSIYSQSICHKSIEWKPLKEIFFDFSFCWRQKTLKFLFILFISAPLYILKYRTVIVHYLEATPAIKMINFSTKKWLCQMALLHAFRCPVKFWKAI